MNEKVTEAMFSSTSVEWNTPQSFYDKLDKKYNFTLDPCATNNSAKCWQYFTKEDDGLSQDWSGHTVFMNPPYGRQISEWIEKAYTESRKPNTKVVCLIPSRTDTRYWHKYCMKADFIYFIKGRLQFENDTSPEKNSAPFPSAVVVFGGENINRAMLNETALVLSLER